MLRKESLFAEHRVDKGTASTDLSRLPAEVAPANFVTPWPAKVAPTNVAHPPAQVVRLEIRPPQGAAHQIGGYASYRPPTPAEMPPHANISQPCQMKHCLLAGGPIASDWYRPRQNKKQIGTGV